MAAAIAASSPGRSPVTTQRPAPAGPSPVTTHNSATSGCREGTRAALTPALPSRRATSACAAISAGELARI